MVAMLATVARSKSATACARHSNSRRVSVILVTGNDRVTGPDGRAGSWLVWLLGSERPLAGSAANISHHAGYAINARTGAARPFTFFPRSSRLANIPSDITYGTVLVPRATETLPP
jgi:hypothetical protein